MLHALLHTIASSPKTWPSRGMLHASGIPEISHCMTKRYAPAPVAPLMTESSACAPAESGRQSSTVGSHSSNPVISTATSRMHWSRQTNDDDT